MTTRRLFLDAHVHHWDPRTTPRAVTPLVKWLGFSDRLLDWVAPRVFPADALHFYGTPTHIVRPYLPADYLADLEGVVDTGGWLHIEAGWEAKGPLGPVGETTWIDSLPTPQGHGVCGIVANADLTLGSGVAAVLEAHVDASRRVRGIRDLLAWHASKTVLNTTPKPERSRSAAFREGFAKLQDFGLTFETTCYSHQLPELIDLAQVFPDQPIIVCHAGLPVGVGGPYGDLGASSEERTRIRRRWQEDMAALAEHPNVFVKLSGLGMPVLGFGFERLEVPPSVDQVAEAIGPLVETLMASFGARRCMFGSNFPVDKASVPLRTLLGAYLAVVSSADEEEQDLLFARTVTEVYGLGSAPA